MHRLSMSPDAAIRSNVFCSFLALAMQKYPEVLAHDAGRRNGENCCAISIG
jgi:hypothetical protein